MNPAPQNPNEGLLLSAVHKLAPLLDRLAFVGGCVTGLLVTDPGAAPARATLDVDVIVEAASYASFILLEEELRSLGFSECREANAPICRWRNADLILDFMPTDPSILNFGSTWYRSALENAQIVRIGDYEILVITAPYFLATKLEAFHGRGKSDFRGSHDIEDIVTVIDGRAEIVDEVRIAPKDLQKKLSREFGDLLSNRDFLEALPGHLLPDAASQQRLGLVIRRMRQFFIED